MKNFDDSSSQQQGTDLQYGKAGAGTAAAAGSSGDKGCANSATSQTGLSQAGSAVQQAAGSGQGPTRRIQGVGVPPRAAAGFEYKQMELDL
eukprot:3043832-Karenia_brevis.AAC.1